MRTEFRELAGDPPAAASRIVHGHALNERNEFGADRRAPDRSRPPAQYRAKPRRCQAMTVDGLTIASASAQRLHNRETITPKARSIGRRRGRGVARRRTASRWRNTTFSRTGLARGRSAANAAPAIAISIASPPSPSLRSVTESPSNRIRHSARPVGSACPRPPLKMRFSP